MNLNGSLHLNSLMLLTWYLISTLHIPPSPALSHCPKHTVAVILCLYVFPMGISFINFLVYSVHLFSLTLSFYALFGVSSQNFKLLFILILVFLTHTFNSQRIKNSIKEKNKTSILTGGERRSLLLLTFSGAILRPLHIISAFLFPDLSFWTPSPLHCGPNPLQLGRVPLLALHQVLKELPDSSVLLHKFLECLFNDTQDPTISGDHGQGVGISVEYIPLLEGNTPGTCEGLAIKGKLLKNNNNKYNY